MNEEMKIETIGLLIHFSTHYNKKKSFFYMMSRIETYF